MECYISPWWYVSIFVIFVIVFSLVIADSIQTKDDSDPDSIHDPKIIAAMVLGSIGMLIMLIITIRDNAPT